ncbi:SDR family NAD(P)-dependent oxidoreductase [Chitinimonas sp. PSY-7]|uniref:SDR family NAD(P)-dependent oxidoreductase n=1 Tax=Chitinimonas sp. PSY-7 TaxID=3459088 RepID=UPI00403FE78E
MTKQTKRTLLIAGYGAGFGAALRDRFEDAGYTVIGVARTSGGAQLQADLTKKEAVHALFNTLDQHHPPLAGVIHNAMAFLREPFISTSEDQMESVWRSMVMTAFHVTQQAVPRLVAQGGGSLIFSGASGSLRAGPKFAAFSSAKFALRGLSQAVAREHADQGIHVAHVVIDGLIRTEKTAKRFPAGDPARMIEPADLADQYFNIFHQPRSAWTQELDIRPQMGSF